MVSPPVAEDTLISPPWPEILTLPLVSETLTSPLPVSIVMSPPVLWMSTSPLVVLTITGLLMSDTETSPRSLRMVTAAPFGTEMSRSTRARESRSEEHTSELQSHLISYAVFCLKKKNKETKYQQVRAES